MARLQVTPLTGSKEKTVWADVLTVRLPSGEHMLCVCSIPVETAYSAGKAFFLELQTYTYTSAENLFTFLSNLPLLNYPGSSCAVLIASQDQYICAAKNAAIFVQRGVTWKTILPNAREWNMVYGAAKNDDILLLITESESDPIAELVRTSKRVDIDATVRKLAPLVQQAENGALACVFAERMSEPQRKKWVLPKATVPHIKLKRFIVILLLLICSLLISIFFIYSSRTHESKKEATAELQVSSDSTQKVNSMKDERSDLPIFYDMRLAVKDFIATISVGVDEYIFAIDAQKQTAILLNTQTKQVSIKIDPIFATAKSAAVIPSEGIAVLSTGIYFIPFNTNEMTPKLIIASGDSNRDATLVGAFGTYIYVLNPAKRALYRYAKQKDSYSSPIGWLQDPLGVPYEKISTLFVDGAVWFGSSSGEAKKFMSGKSNPFVVSGLEPPFSSQIYLTTTEASLDLYVLEPAQKRVVVLSKEGSVRTQIFSPSLAAAQALFASTKDNTLFIINGSLVYTLKP